MKEKTKQFVIFGNFNSISFNDVVQLNKIIKKFGFNLSSCPDPVVPNVGVPVAGPLNLRPLLISQNISFVFGSSRIHFEVLDEEHDNYSQFLENISFLLDELLSNFKISITRVALNGTIAANDQSRVISRAFNKDNPYFDSNTLEWSFTVNNRIVLDEINLPINRLLSGSRLNNVNNENDFIIDMSYDFSTVISNNIPLSTDVIKFFIKKCNELRKNFIDEYFNL